MGDKKNYTCNDYREEMILLGLLKRFNSAELSDDEKKTIEKQIRKIEEKMGMS